VHASVTLPVATSSAANSVVVPCRTYRNEGHQVRQAGPADLGQVMSSARAGLSAGQQSPLGVGMTGALTVLARALPKANRCRRARPAAGGARTSRDSPVTRRSATAAARHRLLDTLRPCPAPHKRAVPLTMHEVVTRPARTSPGATRRHPAVPTPPPVFVRQPTRSESTSSQRERESRRSHVPPRPEATGVSGGPDPASG
jgi:hypothetical protein